MRLRGAGDRCLRACRGGAAVTTRAAIRIVNRPGRRRIYQPSAGGPACRRTHRGVWGTGPQAASRCLAQVRPSNRLVTDPSLKTSWMARAMSGAIDSTVSLSKRFSGGMGSVLVTMTSLIREFLS